MSRNFRVSFRLRVTKTADALRRTAEYGSVGHKLGDCFGMGRANELSTDRKPMFASFSLVFMVLLLLIE